MPANFQITPQPLPRGSHCNMFFQFKYTRAPSVLPTHPKFVSSQYRLKSKRTLSIKFKYLKWKAFHVNTYLQIKRADEAAVAQYHCLRFQHLKCLCVFFIDFICICLRKPQFLSLCVSNSRETLTRLAVNTSNTTPDMAALPFVKRTGKSTAS